MLSKKYFKAYYHALCYIKFKITNNTKTRLAARELWQGSQPCHPVCLRFMVEKAKPMKSWSMSLHWWKVSQVRIIPLTVQGQRSLFLLKISGFIKLKVTEIISVPLSYCSNQIIMYTNYIVQYVVHWTCLTVVSEKICVFINDKCKGTFIVLLCAFMHGV